MPRLRRTKTNFTWGELDPLAHGRADLKAYDNGAARLRNVWIHWLGGVRRRWGTRHVTAVPGAGRLVAFEFNTEQTYLLWLGDQAIRVFKDGVLQATITTPWTLAQVKQAGYTQSADTLLVTHPDVQPRRITRTSHTSWSIATWSFLEEIDTDASPAISRIQQPHRKFAGDEAITLAASATTGSVTLTSGPATNVTGAANNGAGLVRITAVKHGRKTGDKVFIADVGGTTEANGEWTVTVIGDDTLDLQASTFANAWTSGGTVRPSVFVAGHVGSRFRLRNKEVEVTAVTDAAHATATVKETLKGTTADRDWSEPALSTLRGWPVTVTFHQDRMVIGGSRDLPNRLWLSKSADYWNHDKGTGKDDEAIELPVVADQVNAVRAVFSGRHLQVFTSGAEFMLSGEPLAPTKVDLKRQTRVGSPIDRMVMPVSVDGATLFAPRTGRGIKSFLFTDTEQAYQADDAALIAAHLIDQPVDMDYDAANRWLHVVGSDGAVATLTVYREQEVQGWSRSEITGGIVHSVAVVGSATYLLVQRGSAYAIEQFDEALSTDAALTGSDVAGKGTWSGLDHLEGSAVRVVADGADAGTFTVAAGAITLPWPAKTVEAGLAFAHVVEPLPPVIIDAGEEVPAKRLRPVTVTFRLDRTKSLRVDVGRGSQTVPLRRLGTGLLDAPLPEHTGEVTVRMMGWSDSNTRPLWRIEDDTPAPMMLLSVETEIAVNA